MIKFKDFLAESNGVPHLDLPDGHYEIKHGNAGNQYHHSVVSGPHTAKEATKIKTAHENSHQRTYGLNQSHDVLVRKNGQWHNRHHETGEATEHQAVQRWGVHHDERAKD